jgi:hypothetical protein
MTTPNSDTPAANVPADPERLSGRTINYAIELVADGAESHAEDDLDEDDRFAEPDGGEDEGDDPHGDAIGLACDMARMISRNPTAFLAWYSEHRAAELAAQGQEV